MIEDKTWSNISLFRVKVWVYAHENVWLQIPQDARQIHLPEIPLKSQPTIIHLTCHFIGSRAIRIFVTTRSEHMVRSLQCHWLFALLPDPIHVNHMTQVQEEK